MIITISGNPGSGKSTIAKMLVEKLGLERIYAGGTWRRMAEKKSMSAGEFSVYAKTHADETDLELDNAVREEAQKLAAEGKDILVEGRVQYHFISNSIKIFVSVSPEEGAKRVWKDLQQQDTKLARNEGDFNSYEEVLKGTQKREEVDSKRYIQLYGTNYLDLKNYDFVVDTTKITAVEATDKVLKFINTRSEKTKMADKIKLHDFIEIDYTGKLTDGTVFDTTIEEVAKKNGFYNPKVKFSAAIICVGEQQVLPGLDATLIDKEVGTEFEVKLAPEDAFGKRDIKNVKIVPLSTFKEHKMQPYPGLQIDVDGQRGVVVRMSGGRVIVNFNHPLAGKEVIYSVKVHRQITDKTEQLKFYLNSSLRIDMKNIDVTVEGNKAAVKIPINFPEQLSEAIAKRLAEVTGLEEVKIEKAEIK